MVVVLHHYLPQPKDKRATSAAEPFGRPKSVGDFALWRWEEDISSCWVDKIGQRSFDDRREGVLQGTCRSSRPHPGLKECTCLVDEDGRNDAQVPSTRRKQYDQGNFWRIEMKAVT